MDEGLSPLSGNQAPRTEIPGATAALPSAANSDRIMQSMPDKDTRLSQPLPSFSSPAQHAPNGSMQGPLSAVPAQYFNSRVASDANSGTVCFRPAFVTTSAQRTAASSLHAQFMLDAQSTRSTVRGSPQLQASSSSNYRPDEDLLLIKTWFSVSYSQRTMDGTVVLENSGRQNSTIHLLMPGFEKQKACATDSIMCSGVLASI